MKKTTILASSDLSIRTLAMNAAVEISTEMSTVVDIVDSAKKFEEFLCGATEEAQDVSNTGPLESVAGLKVIGGFGLGSEPMQADDDVCDCEDCKQFERKFAEAGLLPGTTLIADLPDVSAECKAYFDSLNLKNIKDLVNAGPDVCEGLTQDDKHVVRALIGGYLRVVMGGVLPDFGALLKKLAANVIPSPNSLAAMVSDGLLSGYQHIPLSDFSDLTSETVGLLNSVGLSTIGQIAAKVDNLTAVYDLPISGHQKGAITHHLATCLSYELNERAMPVEKRNEHEKALKAVRMLADKLAGKSDSKRVVDPVSEPVDDSLHFASVDASVMSHRLMELIQKYTNPRNGVVEIDDQSEDGREFIALIEEGQRNGSVRSHGAIELGKPDGDTVH